LKKFAKEKPDGPSRDVKEILTGSGEVVREKLGGGPNNKLL
jgi:hypothetical protein